MSSLSLQSPSKRQKISNPLPSKKSLQKASAPPLKKQKLEAIISSSNSASSEIDLGKDRTISKKDLRIAIKENNQDLLKVALNAPERDLKKILATALEYKNLDVIRKIILSSNNFINAPLDYARREVESYLASYEFNVEEAHVKGWTLLHLMVIGGHDEIAELLLERGANLELVTAKGYTPLHLAALKERVEITRLLLEAGAKFESQTPHGETPLHFAAWYGHTEIARFLCDKGAKLEAVGTSGDTPLHAAIWKKRKETVQFLLERGAKLEIQNAFETSPLNLAISSGEPEIVRLILDRGVVGIDLAEAVIHPPILEMLLDFDSNDNYSLDDLKNSLIRACVVDFQKGQLENIISILKNHGLIINQPFLKRLKDIASKDGNIETLLVLCKNGVKSPELEWKEDSPFQYFINIIKSGKGSKKGFDAMWQLHLKDPKLRKSLLEFRFENHKTLFLEGASVGNLPFIEWFYEKFILSKDSGIQTVDQQKYIHETALTLAVSKKHFSLAGFLLARGAEFRCLLKPINILDRGTEEDRVKFKAAINTAKDTLKKEFLTIPFPRAITKKEQNPFLVPGLRGLVADYLLHY